MSSPFAAVILLTGAVYACSPARLDVSLDPAQLAVVGSTLRVQVRVKDESGRACAVDRDVAVHLEAADAKQQSLKLSASDITVARGASDGPVTVVVTQTPGLLTVRATSHSLRPGVASAYVRGSIFQRRADLANSPWLVMASFRTVAAQSPRTEPVKVFAHCAEGGEVSANGQDSVVVHADLMDGPYNFDVKLKFATGSLDWDGQIDIPAGAPGKNAEIHSKRIGPVKLDTLLDASPRNVRLDSQGAVSCREVRFISPVQYADLELQSPSIFYGENVQLSVFFRDRDHNRIPVDNADRARIQVVSGKQPVFSDPKLLDGAAVLMCKPNWWGAHRFQLMDGTLKTVHRQGNEWMDGPIELSVLFPWIPLFVCIAGGCAGALIKWKEEEGTLKLHERLFIGVVAALVLMIVAVALPLTASTPLPYPVLLVIPSIVGGFCGSQVFKWIAGKYGIQTSTVPAGGTPKALGGV